MWVAPTGNMISANESMQCNNYCNYAHFLVCEPHSRWRFHRGRAAHSRGLYTIYPQICSFLHASHVTAAWRLMHGLLFIGEHAYMSYNNRTQFQKNFRTTHAVTACVACSCYFTSISRNDLWLIAWNERSVVRSKFSQKKSQRTHQNTKNEVSSYKCCTSLVEIEKTTTNMHHFAVIHIL